MQLVDLLVDLNRGTGRYVVVVEDLDVGLRCVSWWLDALFGEALALAISMASDPLPLPTISDLRRVSLTTFLRDTTCTYYLPYYSRLCWTTLRRCSHVVLLVDAAAQGGDSRKEG